MTGLTGSGAFQVPWIEIRCEIMRFAGIKNGSWKLPPHFDRKSGTTTRATPGEERTQGGTEKVILSYPPIQAHRSSWIVSEIWVHAAIRGSISIGLE